MAKIISLIKRGYKYTLANGIVKTTKRGFQKAKENFFNKDEINFQKQEAENYKLWIKNNEPTDEELNKQREFKFNYEPKISIIVPMYNTDKNYFIELLDSVKNQTYSNWELCLADGSTKKLDYVEDLVKDNKKIKYNSLDGNKGISGNSNEALKMATGDYYALLDHDDLLPIFSLFEIVKAINLDEEAEFIYTDEDKLMEEKDNRLGPHFKSDFAPDTLRSYNYICHFSIFKKSLMEKLVGFDSNFDGSQDYDLILRATEIANRIVHIPKILYHWRMNINSVALSADAKPYAYEAAKRTLQAHLERLNLHGEVLDSEIKGLYRIKYLVQGNPKVSIIIPNKDNIKYLKKCIDSIEKSTYENYEIIVVENNSKEEATKQYYEELEKKNNIKVLNFDQNEFNYSKINNFGVQNASGEYILLLNNDIEIITNDFIEEMLGTCQRDDVGIVGSKLLYADGTIQHAGVVLGLTGIAGHVNLTHKKQDIGYMGKILIQQNFNAVTGAMLMISKADYLKVNGLDEEFPIAYNDVDLCLKIRELGKLIVYTPYVQAYHFESKTRGYDNTPEKKQRLDNDSIKLVKKWSKYFSKEDEYFNVNFRHDVPRISIKI